MPTSTHQPNRDRSSSTSSSSCYALIRPSLQHRQRRIPVGLGQSPTSSSQYISLDCAPRTAAAHSVLVVPAVRLSFRGSVSVILGSTLKWSIIWRLKKKSVPFSFVKVNDQWSYAMHEVHSQRGTHCLFPVLHGCSLIRRYGYSAIYTGDTPVASEECAPQL